MGRKRLPDHEKKTAVKLSIKKSYVDRLRDENVNISNLVQELLTEYLTKNDQKM